MKTCLLSLDLYPKGIRLLHLTSRMGITMWIFACEHQRFLGFCFRINGCVRYFVFASLPFGLATAPFIVTKLLRPLIKHWRAQGKHILIYLDGFGSASTCNAASALSTAMQNDLNNCGFLINILKSHFEPRQCGEFLGYLIDLVNGLFAVPQKKADNLLCMSQSTKDRHLCTPARDVARVTGTIISIGLALGPVARSAVQNSVSSLSERVCLMEGPLMEVDFLDQQLHRLDGSANLAFLTSH